MRISHRLAHALGLAALLLASFVLGRAQTTLLSDAFSDGDLTTNTTGTGHGWVSVSGEDANTQDQVTESGGFANFTSGGNSNTWVMTSDTRDALNPFSATATTTLSANFGGLTFDSDFTRQWIGYRVTGNPFGVDHFIPANGSNTTQGLYLSVLYNSSDGFGSTRKGNLVAISSGRTPTLLASWDWSADPTGAFTVNLTTTATTYAFSFSGGGSPTPTFSVGAASGALTGLGTTSTLFDVGVHWQTNGAYSSTLDSISVTAIPEPSTYAAIFGVGVLGLALWRRRRIA